MNASSPTGRQRLLHRITRRFAVRTEAFALEGQSFTFTRVEDPDVVLDQIVAEEDRLEKLSGQRRASDQLRLPYWAELWDSAIGIGAFLLRQPLSRGSALDLGCGMGFAGMTAQAAGYKVLMADLENDALLFAALNAPGCRTRKLDWNRDRLADRFDLIIGADVLYDKTQWPSLEPFWRVNLRENGTVLLGEPGRQTGDLFVDWIADRGWKMERFTQPVSTRPLPIRLFRLNR